MKIFKVTIGLLLLAFINHLTAAENKAISKRFIPKLNSHVTFIGLGTVELGRDWGIDHSSIHPTEKASRHLLQTSMKSGINLVDTASSYGLSEERIGRYIPQSRYHYLLITKPGEHSILAEDPRCKQKSYDGIYCLKPGAEYDFSRTAIRRDIFSSLQKLHVKIIDVALLHLDNKTALDILKKGEAIAALEELRAEGKIRYIGVSVNGPAAVYAVQHTPIDVVELEYNLLNTSNARAMELAHKKGMGVIVRGGLGTGLLTSFVSKHLQDPHMPYRKSVLTLLKLVNYDYDKLTALALAFLYDNKHISAVIVGADQPHFIQKDINLLNNFHDNHLLAKAKKLSKNFSTPDFYTENMGEYYADQKK